jgi:hypothetical protein
MGPRPQLAKARDEDLLDTLRLGLVQPCPELLHLLFIDRLGGVPRRRLLFVVSTCPQEDEANALVIECVDEFLVGNPHLLQIGE